MAWELPDDLRSLRLLSLRHIRRPSLPVGCNDGSGDPNVQIGANPVLPELQQYFLPPMHPARVVEWKNDETPSVAKGLKIKAMATGLQHPRSL